MKNIRKVGETFEYGDVILRVERDTSTDCNGCYFRYPKMRCEKRDRIITGGCSEGSLTTWVKFVKVREGGEK